MRFNAAPMIVGPVPPDITVAAVFLPPVLPLVA